MNRFYLCPRALLADPMTAPIAKQWHALHVGTVAFVVVDTDGSAAKLFEAQVGVTVLPDVLSATPIPLAVATALATYGITTADTTMTAIGKLRAFWPVALPSFD